MYTLVHWLVFVVGAVLWDTALTKQETEYQFERKVLRPIVEIRNNDSQQFLSHLYTQQKQSCHFNSNTCHFGCSLSRASHFAMF